MDIIEQARELGKQIQNTNEYLELKEAKKGNEKDLELNEMIGKLNLIQLELEASMKNNDKDEEFKRAKNIQLREVYNKINQNKNMKKYKKASDKFVKLMTKINTIVYNSANGGDPSTCSLDNTCSSSCEGCKGASNKTEPPSKIGL